LQEEVAAATPKQTAVEGEKNRKPILKNNAPPQYRITITTTIAPAPAPEKKKKKKKKKLRLG
jgi:hypothetical protein